TLAGSAGLRDGTSQRAEELRHRSRALHRLRLRHGRRASGDAALWRLGLACILRERCSISCAVRVNIVVIPDAACGDPESILILMFRRKAKMDSGFRRNDA